MQEKLELLAPPEEYLVDKSLEEGDKILFIAIDPYSGFATTRIERLENRPYVPGATTTLYRRALEILKEVATITQEPIKYEFSTEIESLKFWAKDPQKGAGIFAWDEIFEENGQLKARKMIYPNQPLI